MPEELDGHFCHIRHLNNNSIIRDITCEQEKSSSGLQPVYGTRWMTPPSYGQSQHQYDQPDHRRDPDLPSAYVPTYTATANEYDMGYYDANGVFHANPNAKSPIPQPPKVHQRSESTTVTDENSHNTPGGAPIASNLPHDLTGNNQHVDDNDSIGDFYRPPQGPPPNRSLTSTSPENTNTNTNTETNQNHTSNITTESMPGSFLRPSGLPPQSSSSSPSLPQNATGNEIREFDNPIPHHHQHQHQVMEIVYPIIPKDQILQLSKKRIKNQTNKNMVLKVF